MLNLMSKRRDKYRNLPVFRKSQEMLDLVEVISTALKDDPVKESLINQMCTNAMIVQAKIAGAEGAGLYSIRMQNAVLIKVAVHDMFNAASFASMVEINEEDYVELLREKVEEFRIEFVNWIRGFDKTYDIPDNWGIRFDTSTPEQEKLEELMFDEDRFLEDDSWDDDDNWEDDEEDSESGDCDDIT